MAAKIIDVSVATIRNTGSQRVSPLGFIFGRTVRAVDDEQVFQSEVIYAGATGILPGQSLTVGVKKRLTIVHFDQESEGRVNQMLVFHADLKQRHIVLGSNEERPYSGPGNFKVQFNDIAGFQRFSVPYIATADHKIEVVYTLDLFA